MDNGFMKWRRGWKCRRRKNYSNKRGKNNYAKQTFKEVSCSFLRSGYDL